MSQIQEKVTIVVPCYNVENYLARCLDSLLAQTYKNLEVIMVEDCSTDDTRALVCEYEKKYDNFHAIYNEKNGGLGNARNVGIAATESKYIGFLDSDDWLPENYVSEMLNTLIEGKADLAMCDVYLRYDDVSKDQRIISYNGKPDKFGLINTGLAATSSAKLFKTELFDNLKYPVDIVNEDIPVTLALIHNRKVVYTDKTHFSYYQRTGSIQNGKVTEKRLDAFKALALLKKNIGAKIDNKLWQAIVWQQVFAVYLYVFPRATGVFERKKLIEKFYNVAKENGIKISLSNPGFRQFVKNNRVDRMYGPRAVKYLNNKRFLKASLIMSCYFFIQNNAALLRPIFKIMKLTKFAILHPIQFAKKLKHKIHLKLTQKYVIKLNASMNDLIVAAKKQDHLVSDTPISVIIPNYNYERFMLQRIYSILYQTEKIGEIIILDDNSTDGSVKMAEKIKKNIGSYVSVRLINNKENRGTFRQWELGFAEARCDYIWIAEADDYSSDKFLKYAVRALNTDPEAVISYVNTGYVNDKGLLMGDVKNDIDYQKTGHWDQSYVNNGLDEARTYTYTNNTIANVSSVVFRKKENINYSSLFKDARQYRQAGDWVFYVNYMVHGDVAYTNEVLNYYRIHGNNVSSTTKAQDHINEILTIQKFLTKKLQLNDRQKAKMATRVKLLKKAWNI